MERKMVSIWKKLASPLLMPFHILLLCRRMGVRCRFFFINDYRFNIARTFLNREGTQEKEKTIFVAFPFTLPSYLGALHELGHLAHSHGLLSYQFEITHKVSLSPEGRQWTKHKAARKKVIDMEVEAWQWAERITEFGWDASVATECLSTYLFAS